MRRDTEGKREDKRETVVRGTSERTDAQTQEYLMDLTLDELVEAVTAINREYRVAS